MIYFVYEGMEKKLLSKIGKEEYTVEMLSRTNDLQRFAVRIIGDSKIYYFELLPAKVSFGEGFGKKVLQKSEQLVLDIEKEAKP